MANTIEETRIFDKQFCLKRILSNKKTLQCLQALQHQNTFFYQERAFL